MVSGKIFAIPNPCPLDTSGEQGTIALVWTTQNVALPEIGVEDIVDGVEHLSAATTKGSVLVNTVEAPPHQYTFRLYARQGDSHTLLDSTVVVANALAAPVGRIAATPNPCVVRPGQCSGLVAVSWLARYVTSVEVTIQDGSVAERPYSSEPSGEVTLEWIEGSPEQTVFRLYNTSNGSPELLDSVAINWLVRD